MKTATVEVFRGSVSDLKPGDRFQRDTHFWIVGVILKPFDSFTVRITARLETGNDYVQYTFGKEVVL